MTNNTPMPRPTPSWLLPVLAVIAVIAGVVYSRNASAAAEQKACPAAGEPIAGLKYRAQVIGPASDNATANAPILVAFHGRGGTTAQIIDPLAGVSKPAIVYAVEGPLVHETGRAYFHARSTDPAFAAELAPAAAKALEFVQQVRRCFAAQGRRVILIGHSQGAHMALDVARLDPKVADGVIAIGGYLPAELEVKALPPTIMIHGANDQVVPVARSRDQAAAWKAAGLPVRFVELAGDHSFTGLIQGRALSELATLMG